MKSRCPGPVRRSRYTADTLRAYLRQAREEVGLRLVGQAYTAEGAHNKFWLAFSRKRFMNMSL